MNLSVPATPPSLTKTIVIRPITIVENNSPILNIDEFLEDRKGYYIYIVKAKGRPGKYFKVLGKPVGIAEMSNYTFFVHKSLEGNGYSVSEMDTGKLIGSGRTIEEAQQSAEEILLSRKIQFFRNYLKSEKISEDVYALLE